MLMELIAVDDIHALATDPAPRNPSGVAKVDLCIILRAFNLNIRPLNIQHK